MRYSSTARRRARSRNRTRTLFYAFLAVILVVIAFSLSARIIDSAVLRQIYIVASVLSIGVVVIDMLGFLGTRPGEEGSADDIDGADGGDGADASASGHDASSDDFDFAEAADDSAHDGTHDDGHQDGWQDDMIVGGGSVLEALRYLRMFIYFCLGFGVVGFATLATGGTAQASLLFAGIAGIGSVALARAFYRLQPKDTGDVISEDELLMELGTVVVPMSHETMGRIRVQIGMQVYEPFARSAHVADVFARGASVRVVKVTDECVYVEGA